MILVVGATGLVGGMIARTLLDQGRDVRILVRPGSNYEALVRAGAEPIEGDLKEPPSLGPACANVDTVISTASSGSRGGSDTPQAVDADGTRHLIDTAVRAGVRQFIYVSTIAASLESPMELIRAKASAEDYLQKSGLEYTNIASDAFLDTMVPLVIGALARAGQPVTLVGDGMRRHSFIAAQDVAAFAVGAVNHAAAINQRVIVGGPKPVSLRDIVSSYEQTLGRSIPVASVAPGEPVPNLPPVPGLAETISGIMAALETFDSPLEVEQTARTFGIRLTPLNEWVQAEVAAVPT